jgi:uncharacterized membrane protein
LAPLLALGALTDLAINLLSSWSNQTSIGYENTAGIVPFVVAASIFGAARFKGQALRLSLWVLVGAASVAIFSPIYVLGGDVRALGSPLVAAKSHALGLIPQGVPVSASNELGGHLSERRYIYTFPSVRRSGWIIVDINDPTLNIPHFKRQVHNYESDHAWQVLFSSHGVSVLHRRPTADRSRP